MANNALFGPAGNCEAFYAAGNKHTVQIFPWLQQQGLTAYEYQCGRGVRLSVASAEAMRAEAERCGITMSLHAPYFISLALSLFVPPVYTAIAFDSGGVASGPMTSGFILPFAIGACIATLAATGVMMLLGSR